MKFKEYKIKSTSEQFAYLNINALCNGEVVGTKTDKGIIKGVAITTADTNINLSGDNKDLRGFIKFDYNNEWHKFYGSNDDVIVDADFGDNALSDRLLYYYEQESRLIVEVDEKIDIDSDNLTIIDGIGQVRNTFDTIRELLEYNCDYSTIMYSRSEIPDHVRDNIEERIKLQDSNREVLDREIIKHDIE